MYNALIARRFMTPLFIGFCIACASAIPAFAQIGPANTLTLRLRGIELYHQKKYGEAADLLKQAITKDKTDADAWYYLGLALITDPKDLKDASKAFETNDARAIGVTGTVVLRCIFTADGVVKHLLVVRGLPAGLTEQSINAARRIKFVPATKDGRPVSTYVQLEYNFHIG